MMYFLFGLIGFLLGGVIERYAYNKHIRIARQYVFSKDVIDVVEGKFDPMTRVDPLDEV